eukprot:365764-Chlamydomonas_euryale.AAC.6
MSAALPPQLSAPEQASYARACLWHARAHRRRLNAGGGARVWYFGAGGARGAVRVDNPDVRLRGGTSVQPQPIITRTLPMLWIGSPNSASVQHILTRPLPML